MTFVLDGYMDISGEQRSILMRLAEVSALLHEEAGNREELLRERVQLVELARGQGLLPPSPGWSGSNLC